MRTALEMTKFVLVHERGYTENPEELDRLVKARLEHMHKKREDLIREGKNPDLVKLGGFPESALTYDSTLRNLQDTMNNILSQGESDYVPLFRPVEQTLAFKSGVSEGNNDVLYALTSHSLWSSNKKDIIKPYSGITGTLQHVAAAFTADRCIIVHWGGGEHKPPKIIKVIPYDDINGVRAEKDKSPFKSPFTDKTTEGLVSTHLSLNVDNEYIFTHFYQDELGWDIACQTIIALVTKYKREKYGVQTDVAAPRQPQHAPQPIPQAAALAAPPTGAGLPPETIETLKQLKGLLDADILTQEEFDAKKKQLLGL